ncbi:MAG: hypothetical protein J6J24_02520 [Clostridia bacterium]|nr:hypothetical protein [Clostridia bacterium]
MNKKKKSLLLKILGAIFLFAGLGLVGYEIYGVFFNEQKTLLNYILLGVGAVLIILGFVFLVVGRSLTKNICLGCGCDLCGCAYEWQLESLQDEIGSNQEDNEYFSKEMAHYVITATCPCCEKKRTYRQAFTAYDYRSRTFVNVNKQIEDWCKHKFGH